MTRHVSLRWSDPRPFVRRDGRSIRILAASDEPDPALDVPRNREALGPIDLVVGCGDLAPDQLSFLGDAMHAPIAYVRGNHDRGGPWPQPRLLPGESVGFDRRSLPGLALLALPWPTGDREPARHDEGSAWWQAIRLAGRSVVLPPASCVVVSHAPPLGAGDTPSDPYHRGFAAYRFLLDRLRPRLWLHGHTTLAARSDWRIEEGRTTLVNVTGTVLLELLPPGQADPLMAARHDR